MDSNKKNKVDVSAEIYSFVFIFSIGLEILCWFINKNSDRDFTTLQNIVNIVTLAVLGINILFGIFNLIKYRKHKKLVGLILGTIFASIGSCIFAFLSIYFYVDPITSTSRHTSYCSQAFNCHDCDNKDNMCTCSYLDGNNTTQDVQCPVDK